MAAALAPLGLLPAGGAGAGAGAGGGAGGIGLPALYEDELYGGHSHCGAGGCSHEVTHSPGHSCCIKSAVVEPELTRALRRGTRSHYLPMLLSYSAWQQRTMRSGKPAKLSPSQTAAVQDAFGPVLTGLLQVNHVRGPLLLDARAVQCHGDIAAAPSAQAGVAALALQNPSHPSKALSKRMRAKEFAQKLWPPMDEEDEEEEEGEEEKELEEKKDQARAESVNGTGESASAFSSARSPFAADTASGSAAASASASPSPASSPASPSLPRPLSICGGGSGPFDANQHQAFHVLVSEAWFAKWLTGVNTGVGGMGTWKVRGTQKKGLGTIARMEVTGAPLLHVQAHPAEVAREEKARAEREERAAKKRKQREASTRPDLTCDCHAPLEEPQEALPLARYRVQPGTRVVIDLHCPCPFTTHARAPRNPLDSAGSRATDPLSDDEDDNDWSGTHSRSAAHRCCRPRLVFDIVADEPLQLPQSGGSSGSGGDDYDDDPEGSSWGASVWGGAPAGGKAKMPKLKPNAASTRKETAVASRSAATGPPASVYTHIYELCKGLQLPKLTRAELLFGEPLLLAPLPLVYALARAAVAGPVRASESYYAQLSYCRSHLAREACVAALDPSSCPSEPLSAADSLAHLADLSRAAAESDRLARTCGCCGMGDANLSCATCGTPYCDRDCQKEAWGSHMHTCKRLAAEAAMTTSSSNSIGSGRSPTASLKPVTPSSFQPQTLRALMGLRLHELRTQHARDEDVAAFKPGTRSVEGCVLPHARLHALVVQAMRGDADGDCGQECAFQTVVGAEGRVDAHKWKQVLREEAVVVALERYLLLRRISIPAAASSGTSVPYALRFAYSRALRHVIAYSLAGPVREFAIARWAELRTLKPEHARALRSVVELVRLDADAAAAATSNDPQSDASSSLPSASPSLSVDERRWVDYQRKQAKLRAEAAARACATESRHGHEEVLGAHAESMSFSDAVGLDASAWKQMDYLSHAVKLLSLEPASSSSLPCSSPSPTSSTSLASLSFAAAPAVAPSSAAAALLISIGSFLPQADWLHFVSLKREWGGLLEPHREAMYHCVAIRQWGMESLNHAMVVAALQSHAETAAAAAASKPDAPSSSSSAAAASAVAAPSQAAQPPSTLSDAAVVAASSGVVSMDTDDDHTAQPTQPMLPVDAKDANSGSSSSSSSAANRAPMVDEPDATRARLSLLPPTRRMPTPTSDLAESASLLVDLAAASSAVPAAPAASTSASVSGSNPASASSSAASAVSTVVFPSWLRYLKYRQAHRDALWGSGTKKDDKQPASGVASSATPPAAATSPSATAQEKLYKSFLQLHPHLTEPQLEELDRLWRSVFCWKQFATRAPAPTGAAAATQLLDPYTHRSRAAKFLFPLPALSSRISDMGPLKLAAQGKIEPIEGESTASSATSSAPSPAAAALSASLFGPMSPSSSASTTRERDLQCLSDRITLGPHPLLECSLRFKMSSSAAASAAAHFFPFFNTLPSSTPKLVPKGSDVVAHSLGAVREALGLKHLLEPHLAQLLFLLQPTASLTLKLLSFAFTDPSAAGHGAVPPALTNPDLQRLAGQADQSYKNAFCICQVTNLWIAHRKPALQNQLDILRMYAAQPNEDEEEEQDQQQQEEKEKEEKQQDDKAVGARADGAKNQEEEESKNGMADVVSSAGSSPSAPQAGSLARPKPLKRPKRPAARFPEFFGSYCVSAPLRSFALPGHSPSPAAGSARSDSLDDPAADDPTLELISCDTHRMSEGEVSDYLAGVKRVLDARSLETLVIRTSLMDARTLARLLELVGSSERTRRSLRALVLVTPFPALNLDAQPSPALLAREHAWKHWTGIERQRENLFIQLRSQVEAHQNLLALMYKRRPVLQHIIAHLPRDHPAVIAQEEAAMAAGGGAASAHALPAAAAASAAHPASSAPGSASASASSSSSSSSSDFVSLDGEFRGPVEDAYRQMTSRMRYIKRQLAQGRRAMRLIRQRIEALKVSQRALGTSGDVEAGVQSAIQNQLNVVDAYVAQLGAPAQAGGQQQPMAVDAEGAAAAGGGDGGAADDDDDDSEFDGQVDGGMPGMGGAAGGMGIPGMQTHLIPGGGLVMDIPLGAFFNGFPGGAEAQEALGQNLQQLLGGGAGGGVIIGGGAVNGPMDLQQLTTMIQQTMQQALGGGGGGPGMGGMGGNADHNPEAETAETEQAHANEDMGVAAAEAATAANAAGTAASPTAAPAVTTAAPSAADAAADAATTAAPVAAAATSASTSTPAVASSSSSSSPAPASAPAARGRSARNASSKAASTLKGGASSGAAAAAASSAAGAGGAAPAAASGHKSAKASRKASAGASSSSASAAAAPAAAAAAAASDPKEAKESKPAGGGKKKKPFDAQEYDREFKAAMGNGAVSAAAASASAAASSSSAGYLSPVSDDELEIDEEEDDEENGAADHFHDELVVDPHEDFDDLPDAEDEYDEEDEYLNDLQEEYDEAYGYDDEDEMGEDESYHGGYSDMDEEEAAALEQEQEELFGGGTPHEGAGAAADAAGPSSSSSSSLPALVQTPFVPAPPSSATALSHAFHSLFSSLRSLRSLHVVSQPESNVTITGHEAPLLFQPEIEQPEPGDGPMPGADHALFTRHLTHPREPRLVYPPIHAVRNSLLASSFLQAASLANLQTVDSIPVRKLLRNEATRVSMPPQGLSGAAWQTLMHLLQSNTSVRTVDLSNWSGSYTLRYLRKNVSPPAHVHVHPQLMSMGSREEFVKQAPTNIKEILDAVEEAEKKEGKASKASKGTEAAAAAASSEAGASSSAAASPNDADAPASASASASAASSSPSSDLTWPLSSTLMFYAVSALTPGLLFHAPPSASTMASFGSALSRSQVAMLAEMLRKNRGLQEVYVEDLLEDEQIEYLDSLLGAPGAQVQCPIISCVTFDSAPLASRLTCPQLRVSATAADRLPRLLEWSVEQPSVVAAQLESVYPEQLADIAAHWVTLLSQLASQRSVQMPSARIVPASPLPSLLWESTVVQGHHPSSLSHPVTAALLRRLQQPYVEALDSTLTHGLTESGARVQWPTALIRMVTDFL